MFSRRVASFLVTLALTWGYPLTAARQQALQEQIRARFGYEVAGAVVIRNRVLPLRVFAEREGPLHGTL